MALLGIVVHEDALAAVLATVVLAIGMSSLIAPPSTVVMNALPEAEAGDGSSLNMVSRFVARSDRRRLIGTVFAAVQSIGSTPAATPRSRSTPAPRRLLGHRARRRAAATRRGRRRFAATKIPA